MAKKDMEHHHIFNYLQYISLIKSQCFPTFPHFFSCFHIFPGENGPRCSPGPPGSQGRGAQRCGQRAAAAAAGSCAAGATGE